MNHEFSKLKQRSEEVVHQRSAQESGTANGHQFQTVEDLLRYDTKQNPPPPEIAEKLNNSIAAEPRPKRSWLSRLLGRN